MIKELLGNLITSLKVKNNINLIGVAVIAFIVHVLLTTFIVAKIWLLAPLLRMMSACFYILYLTSLLLQYLKILTILINHLYLELKSLSKFTL